MLELTRTGSDICGILMETWGAANMAEKCGLITTSSLNRILRYLDNRETKIMEEYEE